ncbi:hypothetical protein GCM10023185_40510 [Hymenobacter saemangeumensis]|uniref:Response regulator transcription factor n=1 Tax=Hymenobacter saemangeumensis TaxID=1084522 RepID=A0ABP8IRJ9_9BACT
MFEAICAGAAGYLLKSTSLPQLKAHLLEVAAGGAAMSKAVPRLLMQAFRPPPSVRVAAVLGG